MDVSPSVSTLDGFSSVYGTDSGLSRKCFVTVGATAGFRPLLEAVLQPEFLSCLAVYHYDRLEVQCGPDQDYRWFQEQLARITDFHGISIHAFTYTSDLKSHILDCRGERMGNVQFKLAGCVISHAGSGTILEVLRIDAPLVVVPNPTLMDNHQLELARECERQGWAVVGDLRDLSRAIQASWRAKEQGRLDFLPPYVEAPFPVPEAERVTLFDWMVLTCYPEEMCKQLHRSELLVMEREALLQQLQHDRERTRTRSGNQTIRQGREEQLAEDRDRLRVD